MSKRTASWLWLALLALPVLSAPAQTTRGEILGISVGMSGAEAIARLEKLGRREKEERKQQEVWTLNDDPRFSHLIVAFSKDYGEVRYVTAKVREGAQVRYQDVLDLTKAKQVGARNNNKYVLEVPAAGSVPGYVLIARGADPHCLTYFSIEKGN